MRGLTLGDPALLGGLGFSPLSLSPQAWYDASDTSTITSSSGAVSQWNDKSGNGRHVTQATAARQPSTGTVTLNGLNTISFDGGDFLGPSSAGISPAANGISLFMVCRNTFDALYQQQAMSQQDSSGTGRGMITKNNTGSTSGGAYSTFLGGTETTVGTHTQSWVIMSVSCDAGSSKTLAISQNTTTSTATRTLEATVGGYYLGVNKTASIATTAWYGQIAEVLLYPSLSATDNTSVLSYLNAKWAVY